MAGTIMWEDRLPQDDIFSFYWRDAYKETMEGYRDGEKTDGVAE